jgi:antitoxin (DNA-binding transcriptional repressor) of toxin-antitoxin stability system
MVTVSVAEAKARLSELIDKAEAGEEIVITRRGKAAARLSAPQAAKRPIAEVLDELAAWRAKQPRPKKSAVKLLLELRKEQR